MGASDRAMFEERNIPKAGGDLERMQEWIRAVRGSMKRMEGRSRSEHGDVRSYFGRTWVRKAGDNGVQRKE